MPGGTRSSGDATGPSSDRDQLAMDPERCPEAIADLADRGIRPHGVQDRRQEVVGAARRVLESSEGGGPRRGVALGPDPAHALDLPPLALGIDPLKGGPDLPCPIVA